MYVYHFNNDDTLFLFPVYKVKKVRFSLPQLRVKGETSDLGRDPELKLSTYYLHVIHYKTVYL